MPAARYEYKSTIFSSRLRKAAEIVEFDELLNYHARAGWEFVSATALSTNSFSSGLTNGLLLTFRREVIV